MATNSYLVLSDGTTTVTIADGASGSTNYRLARGTWAPQVAGLRRNRLGGRGPYDDVTEEFELNITGSSVDAALANLQTLNMLFDQAERWYRNENTCVVLVKYSPKGATVSSSGSPLQAAVLGRAPGDEAATIRLSPIFEDVGLNRFVLNTGVRFQRRGLWIRANELQTGSASNGSIAAITLASPLAIVSPGELRVTNLGQLTASNSYSNAFVLMASGTTDLEVDTLSGLTATGFTNVSDSANFSQSGNILRYTATGTTELFSAGLTLAATGNLSFFLNIRNNSATTTFRVRLKYTNGRSTVYTPTVVIPVSSGPKWYFLGMVNNTVNGGTINVGVMASAASGTLDMDTIVFANSNSPDYACLTLYQPFGGGGETELIDPAALTQVTPYVGHNTSNVRSSYAGDPFLVSRATAMKAIVLQTGSDGSTIHWRVTLSGSVVTNAWSLNRYTGYLSPR